MPSYLQTISSLIVKKCCPVDMDDDISSQGLTQFAHSYSKNGIVRLREIFTPRTLKVPKTQTALKELESVHKVDFPVQGIMEQKPRMLVPRLKLGTQGLEVSKLGFGCGGLSGILNAPLSHEAGCAILKEAFNMGITFFDTADRYGQEGDNEIMIGKALKELPREQVQLASKFGIYKMDFTQVEVKGTLKYVRQCIEASLKRLNVDYIDLYYPHRIDISVPIEETMWELKKLVEEGKIRYIGLSEASVDTIRRAHAVHPITAVEMEYSLWTREIEEDVIPLCRELGIGIVAYSPLGHGFFVGKAIVESLPSQSLLDKHPRFVGENLEKNKVLYARFANLAAKHSCTPPQLALAWLLHRGDDVVPIPGTTKIKNLIDNINSLAVKLTPDDLKEIADAIPIDQVAGEREVVLFSKYNYKLANTPLEKEKLSSSQNTTIN
ncbi:perakine reductase-like isoform X2 [Olea europaea var. sylvestris]|nr:perakine reductase-like isoform X2 [Olea europaea var. sylvestris]